jgi:hypothetical protein
MPIKMIGSEPGNLSRHDTPPGTVLSFVSLWRAAAIVIRDLGL